MNNQPNASNTTDRPFDWVAALALVSGVLVMIPALAALAVTLVGVLLRLIW
jgi:hypothetical protein